MEIGGSEKGDFFIVDIVGKIDRLKDSIILKSYINTIIDKGAANIAINLSEVTYLDSGALNVLIYCHNILSKKGGELAIMQPNDYVKDVLDVVGLNKLVKIYSTREDFENAHKKA